MKNKSDHTTPFRPNLLAALQLHHKYLFLFGLTLVILAMLTPAFSGLLKKQIILPYSNGMFSHPPFIIIFVALLLLSAMTFALIGASHGNFLTRFVTISIVVILLLFFGDRLLAANFILLPVFFVMGYLLWRGSNPIPGHPTLKDILIIFFSILIIWVIAYVVGIIFFDMGVMVTMYLGISQLVGFAAFLPMPLIILSGVDLANVTDKVVEKISIFSNRWGNHMVLTILLATSIVKLGFNLWKIEWHSISSIIFSIIFLVIVMTLVKYTPKQLLEFKPRFKDWIILTAMIQPVPLGIAMILIMIGFPIPIDSGSNLLTVAIGPISLVLAGILFFFQKIRPFSIFITIMGVWIMLTFSLKMTGSLLFDTTFDGLTLWGLDGVTAFIFIIWSAVLLYQRKTSALVPTALKFSIFLSCCFVINQLLTNQVAIAELYTLSQVLTFLVVHQFIARPKQAWWSQALPWLLVVIMFAHNVWSGVFPNGVMSTIKIGILTIAMLWDILMSEEKIRGEKVIGPKRPGLLFIYLGYVIWTLAQVIYAKTGKGSAVFEWEPMLLFGFLFIGIPWVMYLMVKEVKGKLTEVQKT